MFAPVADRAMVPARVMSGVVKDVEADNAVKAPVDAVVAPMVVLFIVPLDIFRSLTLAPSI
jgi:hypothetical protein